jgi:hypothetical protein
VATANLSRLRAEGTYIALIQEPWVIKGKMVGLGETGGKLIYCKSTQTPRTYILLSKNLPAYQIHELYSRDLIAVKVQLHKGSTKREFILASDYLPYDGSTPPPSEEVVIYLSMVTWNSVTSYAANVTNLQHYLPIVMLVLICVLGAEHTTDIIRLCHR